MRRPFIGLVVMLLVAGVAAILVFYNNITFSVVIATGVGLLVGLALAWVRRWLSPATSFAPTRAQVDRLLSSLVDMGDVLQEVSIENLQRRGGWDQALFDDVLAQVEQQAPQFQQALIAYLTQDHALSSDVVRGLLAVDRLSAAYTYWTRLFPPRQPDESMFVLSLLQDLSEKVEHAIRILDR